MALPATRTAAALEKSQIVTKVEPFTDRFWAAKLGTDSKEVKWQVEEEDMEAGEQHVLHLKMAVLGEGCVDKQSNVVMLKTKGADEAEVEACIVQLGKGQGSLMAPCDVTVDGLAGCTMTLVSGDGPVYLSGVYRHEHPLTDELERTQWATDDEGTMDDETAEEPSDEDEDEDDEDEEDEEDEEEEEEESPVKTTKKNAPKGKSPGKGAKNQKKKAGIESEEEFDAEEDMEDEEEEEEEKPVKKAAKKANGAVKGKKEKTAAKSKTPETKKGKKAKAK